MSSGTAPVANAFDRAAINLFGLPVDAELFVASVAIGLLPVALGWMARKQPVPSALAFFAVSLTMAVAATVPLNETSMTYFWENFLSYLLFCIPGLVIGYGAAVFIEKRGVVQ